MQPSSARQKTPPSILGNLQQNLSQALFRYHTQIQGIVRCILTLTFPVGDEHKYQNKLQKLKLN
jgi:hypothetical protein